MGCDLGVIWGVWGLPRCVLGVLSQQGPSWCLGEPLEQRKLQCVMLHRAVIHHPGSEKEAFIKPQLIQLSDGGQGQSKPGRNALGLAHSGLCPPVHGAEIAELGFGWEMLWK